MGFSQFSEAGPPLNQADITAKERSTVGFTFPQLYPASNPYNLVPAATFGVSDSANPSLRVALSSARRREHLYWNASLTKIQGNHSFKFGISPEHWASP